jgi:hypothetical protein
MTARLCGPGVPTQGEQADDDVGDPDSGGNPAAVMTARGEVAGGEQAWHAADGEGGRAVAQGFVGCVGQDEGKNAESDQRECVVSGMACICVVYGNLLSQFYCSESSVTSFRRSFCLAHSRFFCLDAK